MKNIAAKMGWRGEDAEIENEPTSTFPDMSDDVRAEMVAFFAPFDAALRAYMGDALVMEIAKGWHTSKAAGIESPKKKRKQKATAEY